MYECDEDVERDVYKFRRMLAEEPPEHRLMIRAHSTAPLKRNGRGRIRWWIVQAPIGSGASLPWFGFKRTPDGRLNVRQYPPPVTTLTVVDTVEAAMMAGVMLLNRPS